MLGGPAHLVLPMAIIIFDRALPKTERMNETSAIKYFNEIKGDVGMSPRQKRETRRAYTKTR